MEKQLQQQHQKKDLAGFQRESLQNSLIVAQSLQSQEKEVIEAFANHELIGSIKKSNPEAIAGLFRKLIARCLVICSIKNDVDELTMSVLFDYTLKHYGNYTFQEIEKAVIYNQSGDFPQRIEHFQAFDILFLSSIMEQWLILKTKTRQRVSALLPPVIHTPETPESIYNGLVGYVQKHKEFPHSWNWTTVYQFMEEDLQIPETNAEKREIMDKIRKKETDKLELELMTVVGFIEREKKKDELEEKIKILCRKELVIKHLSHLIKN